MNPSLWTPTYIKKEPLSSPSWGGGGKNFRTVLPNKKPETLREEHPWESGFSFASRRSVPSAPPKFFGGSPGPGGLSGQTGSPRRSGSSALRPLNLQG